MHPAGRGSPAFPGTGAGCTTLAHNLVGMRRGYWRSAGGPYLLARGRRLGMPGMPESYVYPGSRCTRGAGHKDLLEKNFETLRGHLRWRLSRSAQRRCREPMCDPIGKA